MVQQLNQSTLEHMKKSFESYALPRMPIVQSRFMAVDGKSYIIVGQQPLDSPLFTHFDVLDETGVRASDSAAKAVYTSISKLQIAEYIGGIEEFLPVENTRISDVDRPIRDGFRNTFQLDVDSIQMENAEIHPTLKRLKQQTHILTQRDQWSSNDLQAFERTFEGFWQLYQSRREKLMDFRQYIIENNHPVSESSYYSLYKEANLVWHLFTNSIPIESPLITNIDDFILLLYQLGKVTVDTKAEHHNIHTAFEKASFTFFKRSFQLFIFILLPLTIVLGLTGVISLTLPAITFALAVFFTMGYLTEKTNHVLKIKKRYKELREKKIAYQPIVETKYQQAFQDIKKRKKQQQEAETYTFTAITTLWYRIIIGFGGLVSLIGLGSLDNIEVAMFYFTFAAIIIILGLLFQKTRLSRQTIQLRTGSIKIGRREFSVDVISEVEISKSEKIVTILSSSQNLKLTYKMSEPNRKTNLEKLKNWCERYYVTLIDKKKRN